MITVFGAGAIGLALAARLARAGGGVRVLYPLGPPIGERGWVLVCVRGPQTEVAADAIAATAPEARIVNVQNGIDGDARVAGAVIRQGCTRVALNQVRTMQKGRIVLGAHPAGLDRSSSRSPRCSATRATTSASRRASPRTAGSSSAST